MKPEHFLSHLHEDLSIVRDIDKMVRETGIRDFMARSAYFSDLRREVRTHLVAERDSLYDALAEYRQAREFAEQAQSAINKLIESLMELNEISKQADIWLDRFIEWKQSYELFFNWEKTNLPKALSQTLSEDDIDLVERRYRIYRDRERRNLEQEETFPF